MGSTKNLCVCTVCIVHVVYIYLKAATIIPGASVINALVGIRVMLISSLCLCVSSPNLLLRTVLSLPAFQL